MSDVAIRRDGHAGRITLTRPKALNALSYEMCLEIDAALQAWAQDRAVSLVVIDAEGEKAFCAGGDIAEIYATGRAGDYSYARRFWRDEYRMNARIAEFPKPVVSFLQGFTMGGGVGLGCHASHRVVGDSSQIAMPECGIGLVPDVGGSLLLARAPGQLGAYLGLTGARMGPGDAIHAGFADLYRTEADWPQIKTALCETGDIAGLTGAPPPQAPLAAEAALIDAAFGQDRLAAVVDALEGTDSAFAQRARAAVLRNSPLAMACALAMLRRLQATDTIRTALALEYRFTHRALGASDFLEGIRAAIIDRDRSPRWRHARVGDVTQAEVAAMLAALGAEELSFETREERTQ